MKVEWADTAALKVIAQDEGVPSARQARAGQSAAAQVPLPNFLTQAEGREALEFVEARRYEIQPDTLKRNVAAPTINAALRVEDGADYIMLVREPSGALRFHDGKEGPIGRLVRRTTLSGNV